MRYILILLSLLIPITLLSQESVEEETPNKSILGGIGNLNFSRATYAKYYSGGGLGNLTMGALVDVYTTKPATKEQKSSKDTNLRVDYGVVKIENTNGEKFTKSSDQVDFLIKYGKPIRNSEHWQYSSAFNIRTQITDTRTAYNQDTDDYTQLIGKNKEKFGTVQSTFLAPADISIGIGTEFKPNKALSVFIGPLTSKIRLVLDEQIAKSGLMGNEVVYNDANQVIDFQNYRFETGANIISSYNKKFLHEDMLTVKTDLKLFSNYLEKPDNIDVSWSTLLSLNPWKFISVNYSTNLEYDDDKLFTALANGEKIEGNPEQGVQFRSILGVGVTHKINTDFEKKKIETEKLFFSAEKKNLPVFKQ